MKITRRILFPLLIIAFALSNGFSQDGATASHTIDISFSEVALLDIEGSGNITLTPTLPTEAGLGIDFTNITDNSNWLNYSSIVGSLTEASRNVSVSISNGTIPAGMAIKVIAGADAGNGDGQMGTPSTQLTLSGSDQTIISGIGSCYTGSGISNGHQLTYTLEASGNYSDIDFDDASNVTILYTISNL